MIKVSRSIYYHKSLSCLGTPNTCRMSFNWWITRKKVNMQFLALRAFEVAIEIGSEHMACYNRKSLYPAQNDAVYQLLLPLVGLPSLAPSSPSPFRPLRRNHHSMLQALASILDMALQHLPAPTNRLSVSHGECI